MKRRPKSVVSYNMSRVRATGSKIEKMMLAGIRKAGMKKYRKNTSEVYGKPDFSWKEYKVAVFCDSDFWHGYKWGKKFKDSFKVRKKFWVNKIQSNMQRDKRVNRKLAEEGWKVLRFWEHEIMRSPEKCILKIEKAMTPKQKLDSIN